METELIRVLLVDDERGFTDMVKVNLELSGKFIVGVENDSTRALKTAREFAPDIVILDVVMPAKDGGDILSELAGDQRLKRVPVVLLTAMISNDETSGGAIVRSGGQMMLAKPVSLDTLIDTIEAELNVRT